MRACLMCFGVAAVLVSACDGGGTSAPDKAPLPSRPTLSQAASAAPPAVIVFRASNGGVHEVYAAAEDGSFAQRLSRPDADTVVAGTLPGRRVALAVYAPDGSLASLELVRVDGSERRELGALPSGRFVRVLASRADGDVLALELVRRSDASQEDVVVARLDAPPVVVAEGATLVALAAERVAFSSAGALRSSALDGTAVRELGAGDGQDRVVDSAGDRLLVSLHDAGLADVRVVKLDGTKLADLGTPERDDRAFGFAGPDRVVLSHKSANQRTLAVVGSDGAGERLLAAGEVVPQLLTAAPTPAQAGGASDAAPELLWSDASGALRAVSLAEGAPVRVLDPAAGPHVHSAKVVGARVFYLGGDNGQALRTARLDGGGANELCTQPTWRPFFATVTADGRAVFYRALAGQLEGGRLFSVKLDGTDLEPFGADVNNPDGSTYAGVLADQDFEAVTPAGRIVFEAEFAETASHLLVSDGGKRARRIVDRDDLKFAAIVE